MKKLFSKLFGKHDEPVKAPLLECGSGSQMWDLSGLSAETIWTIERLIDGNRDQPMSQELINLIGNLIERDTEISGSKLGY